MNISVLLSLLLLGSARCFRPVPRAAPLAFRSRTCAGSSVGSQEDVVKVRQTVGNLTSANS